MTQPKCADCRFWEPASEPATLGTISDGEGYCHRHAPQPIPAHTQAPEQIDRFTVWPVTLSADWCGEGEAKTASPVSGNGVVPRASLTTRQQLRLIGVKVGRVEIAAFELLLQGYTPEQVIRILKIGRTSKLARQDLPAMHEHVRRQSAAKDDVLALPLEVFAQGLSVRAANALHELSGVTPRVFDLVRRTVDDVLELRNVGLCTLGEIQGKLAQHGLSLRDGYQPLPTNNPEYKRGFELGRQAAGQVLPGRA